LTSYVFVNFGLLINKRSTEGLKGAQFLCIDYSAVLIHLITVMPLR